MWQKFEEQLQELFDKIEQLKKENDSLKNDAMRAKASLNEKDQLLETSMTEIEEKIKILEESNEMLSREKAGLERKSLEMGKRQDRAKEKIDALISHLNELTQERREENV